MFWDNGLRDASVQAFEIVVVDGVVELGAGQHAIFKARGTFGVLDELVEITTCEGFHPDRIDEPAPLNIWVMDVTLAVFQADTSPLKAPA